MQPERNVGHTAEERDLTVDLNERAGWLLLHATVSGAAAHYSPEDQGRIPSGKAPFESPAVLGPGRFHQRHIPTGD